MFTSGNKSYLSYIRMLKIKIDIEWLYVYIYILREIWNIINCMVFQAKKTQKNLQ